MSAGPGDGGRRIQFCVVETDGNIPAADLGKTMPVKRESVVRLETDKAGSTGNLEPLDGDWNVPNLLGKKELNATLHLDLTTAIEQANEESDGASAVLPMEIEEVINEPNGSLVRLALAGVNIAGYKEEMVADTLNTLNAYMELCISEGYLDRASYFENAVETVKRDCRELKMYEGLPSVTDADDCLMRALEELSAKELEWQSVEVQLQAEREVAISEVKLQKTEELKMLDEEWGKEQMKRHFNKPSKYLLDLQTQQRRRMEAHRFEEAMQMQGEIDARQDKESQVAGRKMYKAYLQAVKRVEDKYNGYLQNIEGVFQRRKSDLDRRKEIALKPYNNRVAKFETIKKDAQEKLVRSTRRRKITASFEPRLLSRRKMRAPKSPVARLDLPDIVLAPHRRGRRPIVRTSTPGGQHGRPPERRGNVV